MCACFCMCLSSVLFYSSWCRPHVLISLFVNESLSALSTILTINTYLYIYTNIGTNRYLNMFHSLAASLRPSVST